MSDVEEEICGTCRFWDFLYLTHILPMDVLDCKRFPKYEKKRESESCGEWKPRYKKQILHESKE